MANLTPTPGWDEVFQLETDTPVLGGAGGVANSQAQALLNRFGFLEGATGSSRVGHTPAGTGAVATTVEKKLQESKSFEDFGAIGDGVADDSPAFQAAISSGISKITGTPNKSYYLASRIDGQISRRLEIEGNGAKIIPSSAISDTLIWLSGLPYVADNAVYWDVTQRVGGTALGADVSRGARSITVASATGLSKGDWIRIASTENYVTYIASYNKGEMHQIQEISGTTIQLDCGLFDSYTAATTTVFKLLMPEVKITGLTIEGADDDNSLIALQIWECQNVLIDDVKISGCNNRGIDVTFCANVNITNCETHNITKAYVDPSRTSYGVVINSSQYVSVRGGTYKGGRHSFSTGGYDPVRYVVVDGATVVSNDVDGLDVAAMDSHGNIEYLTVRDCHISGGADFAGQNIEVVGCQIDITDEVLCALRFRPALSCQYIKANGNTIFANTESTGGIVIKHLEDNVDIKLVETNNNNIILNTQYGRPGIGFEPQAVLAPSVSVWNCQNNRIANNATSISSTGITTYDSANVTRITEVFRANITGNYVVQGSSAGRAIDIRRTAQGGSIFFGNNNFETTGAVSTFLVQYFDKVVLHENRLLGSLTFSGNNLIRYASHIEVFGGLVTNATFNGIRYLNYTTLNENNLRRENCTKDDANFTPTNSFAAHSWAKVSAAGALTQGYNCTVSKIGVGIYRITFTGRQRANDYCAVATVHSNAGNIPCTVLPINFNACDVYTNGADNQFSFISF